MDLKEGLFSLLSLLCLLLCLSQFVIFLPILTHRLSHFPFYPHPSDFSSSLSSLSLIILARELLTRYLPLFPFLADHVISKSAPDRQERMARFSLAGFKLIYFLFASIWGYWLLREQPWFPRGLGGFRDDWVNELWRNVPFEPVKEEFKSYYMVGLGYHLHSLLYHVFVMPKRNDFAEMLVHHFLAIFLLVYSYLLGYVKIGCLVILIHDVPDVIGYAVKAVVVTKYTIPTLICYVLLLIIWGYTRLYVFPKEIIMATLAKETEQVGKEDHGRFAFFGMLTGLLFLHIYWYFLFLYMGYRAVVKGKVEDIQQKIGEKKKDD